MLTLWKWKSNFYTHIRRHRWMQSQWKMWPHTMPEIGVFSVIFCKQILQIMAILIWLRKRLWIVTTVFRCVVLLSTILFRLLCKCQIEFTILCWWSISFSLYGLIGCRITAFLCDAFFSLPLGLCYIFLKMVVAYCKLLTLCAVCA